VAFPRASFCAIVEVVAEGTDLRLEFDNGYQLAVGHDEQIPVFLGAKPPRQLRFLAPVNRGSLEARLFEQRRHKFSEAIKVLAGGHRSAVASVLVEIFAALFARLATARPPEALDCFAQFPVEVLKQPTHGQFSLVKVEGRAGKQS
jgi:hypothetical protein